MVIIISTIGPTTHALKESFWNTRFQQLDGFYFTLRQEILIGWFSLVGFLKTGQDWHCNSNAYQKLETQQGKGIHIVQLSLFLLYIEVCQRENFIWKRVSFVHVVSGHKNAYWG